MKLVIAPIALSIALFSLSACSTITGQRPVVSPNTGAPIAAPSSGNVGTGILGSLGNGLLGPAASRLDPADRKKALEAEYRALEYAPVGQVTNWKGASGRESGEVVAAQPYQVGSQNCRQYTHSFTIDGAPQTTRGTACRNPDGSWTPLT
ncbi:hypothetical protein C5748_01280 [Phyllobacterium phragmitis]|uniref:Surface antigen domain-containing protein n=1 Tax=Phyllobacterium phragmitis TaxID=2670329 RepID=A0A2S9IZP0_9HYPH|nr:hypothetical protein [Phyllobacterium phragmitis]PRD45997.1 hypothetical protein C5748_01280 [Phyllobacterium phragmitis]